jgi:chromate reductase
MKKCSIVIGSLRKNSNCRAVGKVIAEGLQAADFEVVFPDTGKLALFSEDLEANPPKEWTQFRAEIASSDCVIFITPEYNRGYTACLKNALDVASRPYGQSVWSGKKAGVISVSPGKIGGALALNQLKQVLSFLNMPQLHQPEMYIQADSTFAGGEIADGSTKDYIKSYIAKYIEFVSR